MVFPIAGIASATSAPAHAFRSDFVFSLDPCAYIKPSMLDVARDRMWRPSDLDEVAAFFSVCHSSTSFLSLLFEACWMPYNTPGDNIFFFRFGVPRLCSVCQRAVCKRRPPSIIWYDPGDIRGMKPPGTEVDAAIDEGAACVCFRRAVCSC